MTTSSLHRPDRYPLSSRYEPEWVASLDMGPHPLWQLEDLLASVSLPPGSRVLDLGCGRGATSVFLAQQCDAEVVATDLWIPEPDIRQTMEAAGVADSVTVVDADARSLPFPEDSFDAILSIDAFEYFGTDVRALPTLLRVLKPGGLIGMSTPALNPDPYTGPLHPLVQAAAGWEAAAWHAPQWWAVHWRLSALVEDIDARMQPDGRDNWLTWCAALGEDDDSAVVRMLQGLDDDQIGIALVTASKVTHP